MKKEKAYSLRTSFVTSYTRMCIHPSTALPLYEISHLIFPQAVILCFPGVLFWRFLNGSTELLVGGLLLQGSMLGVVGHL